MYHFSFYNYPNITITVYLVRENLNVIRENLKIVLAIIKFKIYVYIDCHLLFYLVILDRVTQTCKRTA